MKFNYLVWLAAFVLAACAAFVSVVGLGQLFAGAGTTVLIMVGGMEFGKLVAASALHRYWDKISTIIKIYMTIGVIVLISLTSVGIYGFLSNGYQKTANAYTIETSQTDIYEGKKAIYVKRIADGDKIIENKNKRSETLSDLRNNQEVRLDSLLAKNYITNANRVRRDIEAANEEIGELNKDIDEIMEKNISWADSVAAYDMKILKVQSASEVTAELGPLKYLADLTGWGMGRVVNWLIVIIMLVFDPMAVSLLIMANSIREIEAGEVKPTPKPKKKWFGKLRDRFKKKPKTDPKTGQVDIQYDASKPQKEDLYIPLKEDDEPIVELDKNGTFKVPVEPVKDYPLVEIPEGTFKGEPLFEVREERKEEKTMVDVALENEKKGKRNFSVDIPDPKPIEVPEPTKLGRIWSKRDRKK